MVSSAATAPCVFCSLHFLCGKLHGTEGQPCSSTDELPGRGAEATSEQLVVHENMRIHSVSIACFYSGQVCNICVTSKGQLFLRRALTSDLYFHKKLNPSIAWVLAKVREPHRINMNLRQQ